MRALLDRIIIKEPVITENKTETGIVLKKTISREDSIAVPVFEVGPDLKDIKKGDTILITNFAGEKFKYNNETFRLLTESEIIAVL